MDLTQRAIAHAALGDERRLLIVEQLALGDCTVAELAGASDMRGNLLAHHLDVLEQSGLIERRVSEGDHRRKYVSLRWVGLPRKFHVPPWDHRDVAFICTHNSARSQFAAALWEQTTGRRADSAGNDPAARVHPTAVEVAAEFGIDISSAEPGGYGRFTTEPDLIVSVCDRAREAGVPTARAHVHWSVPDPVASGTLKAFRTAFTEISERVAHMAERADRA